MPAAGETPEALGVDIVGVLIDRVSEDVPSDVLGPERVAGVPPVKDASESVARLVAERFHDRVWLVSCAAEATEQPLLDWLESHGFFRVTGVARDRVRFCRERQRDAIGA
jgi:hypothetical protein